MPMQAPGQPLGPWAELVAIGTREAMSRLSQLLGSEIDVSALTLRRMPLAQLELPLGGRDAEVVWVYLAVSGSVDGHLMFIYQPGIACGFIDLLLGNPPHTTSVIDAMGYSALGEMGNIIGAGFLAAIGGPRGGRSRPRRRW